MKYKVTIREHWERVVLVEADSIDQAQDAALGKEDNILTETFEYVQIEEDGIDIEEVTE